MQYRVGQYILDTHKQVLLKEKDRSVVSDSYRIIEVLTILAKEHPRVVSRPELLEAIWPNKEVTDWALSRLVADIRRLIEENGEQEQILNTVHGIGFRLAVPVTILAEEDQVEPSTSAPRKNRRSLLLPGISLTVACVIALVIFFMSTSRDSANDGSLPLDQDPRVKLQGQRWDRNEKIEELPMRDGWTTRNNLPVDFKDGVSFSPTTSMQKLGSTYPGPANLNNAVIIFDISVSQEYLDSGASVQPFAVLLFGNWRGEWNCVIENKALSTERKTYQCKLEEPGAIFNIAAGERIRIGVQALSETPVAGTITIHQVKIKHAPSFVDKGWLSLNNLPITYEGGVQYEPKDGGQRLEFKYNGPENFQGATIIFTIEASQEYIDSGATILPFAQKPGEIWPGEWSCWTPNSALSPAGSRVECYLDEPNDIFNLSEDESLMIGIMSQRGERRMEGTVKIKNVEIVFP